MLSERFKEYDPILVYNPHSFHFAVEIRGILYDITGEIREENEDYIEWDTYQGDDRDMIEEICIFFKGGE